MSLNAGNTDRNSFLSVYVVVLHDIITHLFRLFPFDVPLIIDDHTILLQIFLSYTSSTQNDFNLLLLTLLA